MKYVIAILMIVISAYLFKKAAGNLKINLINVISYVFYSLLFFEFIGVTLVYLGFRDHYIIQKISNEQSINIAYWCMAYTMIVLPIVIMIANKFIFKIKNTNEYYLENLKKETIKENKEKQDIVFILIVVALIICFIATVYVFYCIGYVPLLKYFDMDFNFATERIQSGRNFEGNKYVKNIIMLIITPILSHIAYVYMRTTKEKNGQYCSLYPILNIFIKTYDFSKAPIIYYVCFFFILEVMLGKTFEIKKVLPYIAIAIILVIVSYTVILGYNGKIFSLTTGPLSRIIISQAGTLILHFDAFPEKVDYLMGHSFPPFTSLIFGKGEYDIKSGRILMETYNQNAINNGTAGVMSTMFIGEAYANFGLVGVAISPIIVGAILSGVLCIYMKSKKSMLNIVLYLESFIIFTTVLQGGFVEFFYNIQFLVTLIVIFGIKLLSSEKVVTRLKMWREKNEIQKNVISNLILHVITIIIGFFTSILIARGLGAERQGQFSYYVLIFGLIATYGHLGIVSATSYFIKRTKLKKEEIINTNITILLILSLIYSIAIIIFKNTIFTTEINTLLIIWIAYTIILLFNNFFITLYVAEENIYIYNRYFIFTYIIKAIVIISLYYTNKLNIMNISILYTFLETIKIILLLKGIKLKYHFNFDIKILKEELKYGMPLYLAGLFIYLNYRVDQIAVRKILGNEQLGLYAIAVQLADLAFIFPDSIKSALEGRLYNCNGKEEKKQISAQIIKFAFYATLLICIIGMLCKPLVTVLYGVEYTNSGIVMVILLIGIPFCAIGKVAPTYFSTEGKTKIHLKVTAMVLIINLILNSLFIPKIGINGAALASTMAYIFYGIVYIILLKKENIPVKELLVLQKKDLNYVKNAVLTKIEELKAKN